MASVMNLIPKAPRKDFHKLMYNNNKILRFTAKFANPKPEDVLRRFVFNFYMWDDTMGIHEPPQRNLGIITGKFLEKAVHLNQKTGRLFEPSDCLPGNIIQVNNWEFVMLEMDEFTRKCLSEELSGATYDLPAVLEKLVEEMREALQKFAFQMSDEECTTIMRHFDTRQDGQISYNEFADALLDADYPAAYK